MIAYVDVGGTTTHIVVTEPGSKPVHEFVFPSNAESLRTQIQSTIAPYKVKKVVAGIRGVWTPQERRFWLKRLKGLAKSIDVKSDVELAHELVFPSGDGILLNAGTGSICYGSFRGRSARSGGLGPLLGDEGSGFWIGRQALRAQLARDGNLSAVRKFAKHPNAIRQIAGLAQPIVERAARGKGNERKLIEEAHLELIAIIDDVRRQLRCKNAVRLELAGGLFRNEWFKRRFLKKLK